MRERIESVAVAAAIGAMVALAFAQHWHVLSASPYPIGVDGYFYPIQVRSLLEHGTLQYPSAPLAFWFMAPFAAATDPITGAKLGAALGCALIAIPAYLLGRRLGRSRGAGLVAAALASASAGSAFLTIEFVKQGLGLTVGLAALATILWALDGPTRKRLGCAAAAVLATYLTHKLAAVIIVLVAAPAVAIEARRRLRGRRLIYALLAVLVTAIVLLVVGLVAPHRFVSPSDFALLQDAFSSDAYWDAPALVTPRLTLAFDHEATVGGLLAVFAIPLVLVRQRWLMNRWGLRKVVAFAQLDDEPGGRRDAAVTWVVVGLALAIALPWLAVTDPQGLAFRLRAAAFVPVALLAAWLARGMASVAPTWLRDGVLAIIAACVFARGMMQDRTEGQVLTHPALAAAVMAATDQIPSNATVIVPERHIVFMVAWYTRAKVTLRPDSVPYAQRVRLFGLAFIGGPGAPLDRALDDARKDPTVTPPLGLHPRHRNGLVLVTEPTWDWLLAHMLPKPRAYFSKWPTI